MADQGELRVVVVLLVIPVLGVELLGEEGVDGRLAPAGGSHFVGAGGRVERAQESQVGLRNGAKVQLESWHGVVRPC
ncbi:hypothetical protein D9M71_312240 [compost metagenome]